MVRETGGHGKTGLLLSQFPLECDMSRENVVEHIWNVRGRSGCLLFCLICLSVSLVSLIVALLVFLDFDELRVRNGAAGDD